MDHSDLFPMAPSLIWFFSHGSESKLRNQWLICEDFQKSKWGRYEGFKTKRYKNGNSQKGKFSFLGRSQNTFKTLFENCPFWELPFLDLFVLKPSYRPPFDFWNFWKSSQINHWFLDFDLEPWEKRKIRLGLDLHEWFSQITRDDSDSLTALVVGC